MTSKTKARANEFTQADFDELAAELGGHPEDCDFEHVVHEDNVQHTVKGTLNADRHAKRVAAAADASAA